MIIMYSDSDNSLEDEEHGLILGQNSTIDIFNN